MDTDSDPTAEESGLTTELRDGVGSEGFVVGALAGIWALLKGCEATSSCKVINRGGTTAASLICLK